MQQLLKYSRNWSIAMCFLAVSATAQDLPLPPEAPSPPNEPALEGASAEDVVKERYANGRVKVVRHVAQDAERNYVNHGPWRMFDREGRAIASGAFAMGQRHGDWQRIHREKPPVENDGVAVDDFHAPMHSTASFVQGQLHGTWLIKDAKGRLVRSVEFKDGQLHGKSVSWYPNGNRREEVHYQDGCRHGTRQTWTSHGDSRAHEEYEHGRKVTVVSAKYSSGQPRVKGCVLGRKEVLDVQCDWWSGVCDIQVASWEGQPQRHGAWVYYYPDGNPKFKGTFADGSAVGTHRGYYSNGQKRFEGNMDGGKRHGLWRWWFADGGPRLEGQFDHGVKRGTWVRWDAEGNIIDQQTHSVLASQETPPEAGGGQPTEHASAPENSEAISITPLQN